MTNLIRSSQLLNNYGAKGPIANTTSVLAAIHTLVVNSLVSLVERDTDTSEEIGYYQFDGRGTFALRVISVTSSSCSLFCCLLMFYTYLAMHPSRLKFRHQLILILIIYDFLKALAILIYPVMMIAENNATVDSSTIDFLGFFTAMSIEGGDLAILAFAIHTCLTFFNTKRSGGLAPWRYWYYASTVIIPCVLASLAFINEAGYVSLDVWCYLPENPRWMGLALSFGPRYFIMLTILIIYFTIYFYVRNQLKKMDQERKEAIDHMETRKWWSLGRLFEKQVMKSVPTAPPSGPMSSNQEIIKNLDINVQLLHANSQRLRTRYRIISRQMRMIFLYPIAYFFIWIIPVVEGGLRLHDIRSYAVAVLLSWINPFNGVVDTTVFMIREKPWR